MQDRTNNTGVTQIIGSKDSKVTPLMSYSAITTHSEMALAFVDHILNYCHNLIPEKKMTAEDLITICHAALQRKREINILEGKYLRGRIAEQLSRAKRYGEPFSIMSLKLKAGIDDNTYDTLLDSLRERLRTSDIIFMFKNTIMIMLPHTDQNSLNLLI
ncbi:MAG: hypothetical protein JXR91_07780, partial [Deltaproteobacteria bacterium]|nr:hypothetical protein [Deltaproteobacteria bacterium]